MNVFIGPFPENDGGERVVNVQIDPDDTWNMDETLAHIILPMLRQLKATKQGSPWVDNADVPEGLQVVGNKDNDGWTDYFDQQWHARWGYVLDSMLWSFEQLLTDWQEQCYEVVPGLGYMPSDQGAMDAHEERIAYGLKMFGKYYRSLWC